MIKIQCNETRWQHDSYEIILIEHPKFFLTICCVLTYPPTLKTLMTVTKYSHEKKIENLLVMSFSRQSII